MRRTLAVLALLAVPAPALACQYDEAAPFITIRHIPTALLVGEENVVTFRIDRAGCFEAVIPQYYRAQGTHTTQLDDEQMNRLRYIIKSGGLDGLTQQKLADAAKAKSFGGAEPAVTDAAITEIALAGERSKRLDEPVRIKALAARDIRPVAREWHALQLLDAEVSAVADALTSEKL